MKSGEGRPPGPLTFLSDPAPPTLEQHGTGKSCGHRSSSTEYPFSHRGPRGQHPSLTGLPEQNWRGEVGRRRRVIVPTGRGTTRSPPRSCPSSSRVGGEAAGHELRSGGDPVTSTPSTSLRLRPREVARRRRAVPARGQGRQVGHGHQDAWSPPPGRTSTRATSPTWPASSRRLTTWRSISRPSRARGRRARQEHQERRCV